MCQGGGYIRRVAPCSQRNSSRERPRVYFSTGRKKRKRTPAVYRSLVCLFTFLIFTLFLCSKYKYIYGDVCLRLLFLSLSPAKLDSKAPPKVQYQTSHRETNHKTTKQTANRSKTKTYIIKCAHSQQPAAILATTQPPTQQQQQNVRFLVCGCYFLSCVSAPSLSVFLRGLQGLLFAGCLRFTSILKSGAAREPRVVRVLALLEEDARSD